MGVKCPPYYGKSEFYHKEKEKALKKIAELEKVVKECDAELAKLEKDE